jgi:RNA-directed DNA polymerase
LETSTEKGLPPNLAQLRAKLGLKAKQEPNFRFYTLYGHICKMEVLETAWKQVLKNGGACGYDGITLEDVKIRGVHEYLEGIRESLIMRTYLPDPVKRVYIPKSDGSLRALGIPTVKDRIVQMALLLIIEPIFEADFLNCSYGYRPDKSAHQAIDAIMKALYEGKLEVYDADLEKYFNSIPHDNLMKVVQRRIVDNRVLNLIKMWLKAPIWEKGKPMNKNDRGTQQGGVISPILSNLYLHWFDKVFYSSKGPGEWARAIMIRYCDDFVIMAKFIGPKIKEWVQRIIEGKFELKINSKKTKIISLKRDKSSVNFLGFTIRRLRQGKYQIQPTKQAQKKARLRVRELTSVKYGCLEIDKVIKRLNLFLSSWGRYFNKGSPSYAYNAMNWYASQRMVNFLERRSQKGFKRPEGKSWYKVLKGMGLYTLTRSSLGKSKRTFKRRFM